MIQHNTDFHDYLFNVADNPPLIQLITDLRTRLHIVRYAAWAAPQVLMKIVEEHKVILKALKDKDLKTLDIGTQLPSAIFRRKLERQTKLKKN